jgi:hypothetical protein
MSINPRIWFQTVRLISALTFWMKFNPEYQEEKISWIFRPKNGFVNVSLCRLGNENVLHSFMYIRA